MHPLVWIGILLGGIAFWRRKKLKGDTEKVKATALGAKTAATEKIASVRGGRSAEPASVEADAEGEVIDVTDSAPSADAAAEEAVAEAAEETAAE